MSLAMATKHFGNALEYLERAEQSLQIVSRALQDEGWERTSVYSFIVKERFKIRMIMQRLNGVMEKKINIKGG